MWALPGLFKIKRMGKFKEMFVRFFSKESYNVTKKKFMHLLNEAKL